MVLLSRWVLDIWIIVLFILLEKPGTDLRKKKVVHVLVLMELLDC